MQTILGGLLLLILASAVAGCGRGTLGGAAAGVLGAGAGYEYSAKHQMDKLDEDLASGAITQQEYDIRRDQVQRGSLTQ